MQPTILYIHDPTALLAPQALRELWAGLSPAEDRPWRLERCRALGWQVRRAGPDPEAFADLFGWTDMGAVRSLCSATQPAQALPHLTKLMGLDPLEAWRTIT